MTGADMTWLGLNGKTVVVTGGSGGIGRACLQAFNDAGARVVSLDYAQADARMAAKAIDPSGDRALGLGCDVSSEASVNAAAAKVAQTWGGADILVNNAG
ncbi:SDR family NAD(P)-dependent oxidoreductase, partial [Actibacterium sp.]|uniref:SDR family NAD(P)-dependent oxidoreductase n=1 Tax=Actibacterium sp. TaxID=1872125 RepID=UPI003568DDB9